MGSWYRQFSNCPYSIKQIFYHVKCQPLMVMNIHELEYFLGIPLAFSKCFQQKKVVQEWQSKVEDLNQFNVNQAVVRKAYLGFI